MPRFFDENDYDGAFWYGFDSDDFTLKRVAVPNGKLEVILHVADWNWPCALKANSAHFDYSCWATAYAEPTPLIRVDLAKPSERELYDVSSEGELLAMDGDDDFVRGSIHALPPPDQVSEADVSLFRVDARGTATRLLSDSAPPFQPFQCSRGARPHSQSPDSAAMQLS
jgi:hypothetical protein